MLGAAVLGLACFVGLLSARWRQLEAYLYLTNNSSSELYVAVFSEGAIDMVLVRFRVEGGCEIRL
jgi:hypothetical protein